MNIGLENRSSMNRVLALSAVDRRRAVTGIVVMATAFMLPQGGAADTNEKIEFTRATMAHFYDLIHDQVQSKAEIERQLIALLDVSFDVPTMSRFVLGRYWRSASTEEREEYQNIFSTYIVKNYLETAIDRSEAAKNTWEIVGIRAVDDVDTFVICRIDRPTEPPIELLWRVRQFEGRYRMIDVMLDGISALSAVRDDFTSVIRSNGGKVDSLIALMRARIEARG